MESPALRTRPGDWGKTPPGQPPKPLGSCQTRDPATAASDETARPSLDAGPVDRPQSAPPAQTGWFASTHWSVVLAASQGDLRASGVALEKLCNTYWKPLFVFARRLGHSEHDAQDLTQAFFEQFLEKGYIRAADPRRGRFRSFLLTSFRHFLAKEWAKTRTAKRGAGLTFVSFEELTPGETAQLQQTTKLSPEAAYDHQWAMRVFDLALGRLHAEFAALGKHHQFDQLKAFLSRLGSNADYRVAAERCGLSEGAVAVAVRRLRVRYGELLRAEIANTVAKPEDIEDELQLLTDVLTA